MKIRAASVAIWTLIAVMGLTGVTPYKGTRVDTFLIGVIWAISLMRLIDEWKLGRRD